MNITTDTSIITLVILAAQIISRAIPDSADGFLGIVRKIAKVIGLYVKNKE